MITTAENTAAIVAMAVAMREACENMTTAAEYTAWCSNADVTTRPAPYLAARIAQLSASVPPDVK